MSILEGLSGKKKSLILVVLGIVGVLLIVFGSIKDDGTKTEENSPKNQSAEEYITGLENKIGNITEQITGSSRVRVIVNIASGSEFQYLSNEEIKENASSREYVTVRGEDGDSPILLKEIYPEIVGVSIACKGGDSPEVQEKLIRVIATAYDISSNRICIVGIP